MAYVSFLLATNIGAAFDRLFGAFLFALGLLLLELVD